ncbi:MAG: PEP-CTERM sorting domain-containing protein [Bryobacteraceae bacterium]|nr:PEP-CTERM sorting domain-containing protein [Bryobacteraceae bacterium]
MRLFACLAVALASAHAATIVDNLTGGPYQNGTAVGGTSQSALTMQALGIDVGAAALQFVSLDTIFSNNSQTTTKSVSGGIYADLAGNPGTLLVSFNFVNIPAQSLHAPIQSTASISLQANTRYWFVLTGPGGSETSLNWETSGNNAPVGSIYAATVGFRNSTNSGTSWSASTVNNQLRINAVPDFNIEPVPEPSTFVLAATGFLLASRLRRRS